MEIIENRALTKDIYTLTLKGDFDYDQVQPGQFVNLLIGSGLAHPLRRPLSIAESDPLLGRLSLVYRLVGAGTKWLSEQKKGDHIDVLGPLGRGFPLPPAGSRVLIVGGGVGLPPLYQLVRELAARGFSCDLIFGFRSKEDAFWLDEFAAYARPTVCTEDGSLGRMGLVTSALEAGKEWSFVYSCGPRGMLKALKEHFSGMNVTGFVSLEERMACGIGACLGCVCQTADGRGRLRVCADGPVFAWEEVAL